MVRIRYAGFAFAVLPRSFLIHYPHPKSTAKLTWLSNATVHSRVDRQFNKYMSELTVKYHISPSNPPRTPLCRGSKDYTSTTIRSFGKNEISGQVSWV